MLDLVTWCWSKPVMPSMCIDLKSRNVDWKYMIHHLVNEIRAARIAIAKIQSSQNNHNNKKLSAKKKNAMNEKQKRKALEICTTEVGNRGHLMLRGYPPLKQLLELAAETGSKTSTNFLLQHMPKEAGDVWEQKQLKEYRKLIYVEAGKYSKRRRSNVAVMIVGIFFFISSFLFYCLLLNHSFQTNPNKITYCFQLYSLLQFYKLHLLNAFVYFDF